MSVREVVVTFRSIPDRGRTIGWLCWPGRGDHVDGTPLGRGRTIPEAFDHMIRGISEVIVDKTLSDGFGNQVLG